MSIKTFKKFNSPMFSFFKKNQNDKKLDIGLFGKLVAIDTKVKSSDGFNLIHIYKIKDRDGKIGKFLGNIKYKGSHISFRRSVSQIVEEIPNWRDLSESEEKLINKK